MISRRSFLAASGLSASLLPLLESDLRAAGCLATGPKRLVIVHWPNGVSGWPAPASGAALKLPGTMASLEPYKADCLFIKKLFFPPYRINGHASVAVLLTGKKAVKQVERFSIADGISIDQHIAQGLAAKGFTGIPSLNLGALHRDSSTQWRGSQQPVLPDNDPYHVFDTLFSGATSGDLDRLRVSRKSVLDQVKRDLDRYAKRLSVEDRRQIEAHHASIREVETQLVPGGSPVNCTSTAPAKGVDINKVSEFPKLIKLQMDMCVAALAADRSRVAVLQLGNDSNFHIPASWLGFSESHHDIAHNPGDRKPKLDQWYFEMFAYLLGKMKATTEGARTLLDNSAVVFMNNMWEGKSHDTSQLPWFIAGGCGGYFKTGRSIEASVAHNRVLISLANAMGVPTATFGTDPGTELTELSG